MSYPPEPNNPYGPPPQNTPGGAPDNPYGQAPQSQPGYGYPQQSAQPAPGYGYPQADQSPYATPNAGGYGYPQQGGYPGGPGGAPTGYVEVPGRGLVHLATGGQRVGARIIDTVIIYAATMVVYLIFGVGMMAASSASDPSTGSGIAAGGLIFFLLIIFLLMVCYEPVLTATMGATLGKKMLGIAVIDSRNGQKIGFGSSLLRWGFPAIVGMFTCQLGSLLILLSPFFDSTGKLQGWHDKAANSYVVNTKS